MLCRHAIHAAGLALALATRGAGAQPSAPASDPPADTIPAAPSSAARRRAALPDWLAVHGYLTQAAGASRGGQVSGLPAGGTADQRRAALLVRVLPTPDDRVVVQLAHRRIGPSPMAQYQPDVKLDWLFYEHAFGDATRVRAGRVPIPWGIYNETRYVGTLLPFFQAPSSVYREKEFSSEALDGGMVTQEVNLGRSFSIEASAYAGGFRYVEASPLPAVPTLPPGMDLATALAAAQAGLLPPEALAGGWTYGTARARASLAGTSLWLTTPIPGLRVGGGVLRGRLRGGLRPDGGVAPLRISYFGVDGTFDHVVARAETFDANLGAAGVRGGYVQLGGRVAGPLSVYGQVDYGNMRIDFLPLPPTYAVRSLNLAQNRDHAVSLVWAFRPTLQARVEGHHTRGYNAEEALDLTAAPRRGRYAILSLSAAY